MDGEYIYELHKFLCQEDKNDAEKEMWTDKHVNYIPNKKLYRYRPFAEKEINILRNNSIWLSDPTLFLDDFDSIIPIEYISELPLYLEVGFSMEIAYVTAKKMLEEDGETITREEFFSSGTKVLKKYKSISMDKMEEDVKELFGDEIYNQYKNSSFERRTKVTEFCEKESEETLSFFDRLSISPRHTLSITSFTIRHDNRNMWENYADNYTGFCVEYDFSRAKEFVRGEDVLHILPVEYYEERPKFDMEFLVDEYIRMKVANRLNKDWIEDFMSQYYLAILSKQIDYRAEEEWRYIGGLEQRGEHVFPFINAIYIGKNMKEENRKIIQDVARELNVPVYIQEVDFKNALFKYNLLDNPL